MIKQRRLFPFQLFFLIICSLILSFIPITLSKGMIDFQYTEYAIDNTKQQSNKIKLSFQQLKLKKEDFKLNNSCQLYDKLTKQLEQSNQPTDIQNMDDYLKTLRVQFQRLFTLSQNIKNSQGKIIYYEKLLINAKEIKPSEQKLVQMENYQKQLKEITYKIRQSQQKLKEHFSKLNKYQEQSNIHQSKRIQLQYQIDFQNQKIKYLKNMQKEISKILNQFGYRNYTQYFTELKQQFQNQTKLMQLIDQIVNKQQQLIKLRKQKTQLQSKLSGLKLYIEDKQSCLKQEQNIKKQLKNHEKINQLISELKVLKQNQQPNEYCKGVVIKLTSKIIYMIKYSDIITQCATSLGAKQKQYIDVQNKLGQVELKIQAFQKIQYIGQFNRTYQKQINKIQQIYDKSHEWKLSNYLLFIHFLGQYVHQSETIQSTIQKSQQRLNELKRQLTNLPLDQNNGKTVSINLINLIQNLKQLKLIYCQLYVKYDKLSNQVWHQAYQYQAEMKLKNKLLKSKYQEKINLQKYKKEIIILKNQIHARLN